jgi:hydroxymethylbilane synthase
VTIRLGTRRSALALAQARWVAERLEDEVELVPIRTAGDERRGPAPETSDKARFVKEIEEALLAGEIDLAVHSAKDVPGELPDGLDIVGVPARADARDALCGAGSLAELAEGAVVGTASVRRRSALLALRPDLRIQGLRGNVDTRLRRLAEGAYDAIVLACAGLHRLGRDDDQAVAAAAAALTDTDALTALTAERALVATLGASCHTPVGAYAEPLGETLRLTAFVGLPDGSHWIRDTLEGSPSDPVALGAEVADRLAAAGAGEVLAAAELEAAPR